MNLAKRITRMAFATHGALEGEVNVVCSQDISSYVLSARLRRREVGSQVGAQLEHLERRGFDV